MGLEIFVREQLDALACETTLDSCHSLTKVVLECGPAILVDFYRSYVTGLISSDICVTLFSQTLLFKSMMDRQAK